MRTIDELSIEEIDGRICLIFKADDSRFRGLLGALSLELIRKLSSGEREPGQASLALTKTESGPLRLSLRLPKK